MEGLTDIIVIGAGVIGCSVARALSRYQASIKVLERAYDVAEGSSKANSGIVHAGYDAVPGTQKARLNVMGAAMYPALCEELGVPYKKNGALVVAFSESDRGTLEKLLQQGLDNGVEGLEILEKDALRAMEPEISDQAVAALHVPTSGIVSPYEMTYALADHAAINGVEFALNTAVESVSYEDGIWHVRTDHGEETCRILVNCAGYDSGRLHEAMGGEPMEIVHRRGQYYILDHPDHMPFTHTMFQCPTKMGKGILVAPTVHENVLLGPTAEDIDDPLDTETTSDGLAEVIRTAALTWPKISVRTAVTNFSGVRAHATGGDFVVGAVGNGKHAYEAAGMESPGLSAAPAVGEVLSEQIASGEGLVRKTEWKPMQKKSKPFNEMNAQERTEAVKEKPLHGNIICRCEVVTEQEIREAIRRPVGATTIDGVKRRTRAGMGRCQGGFCSPRVAEILAEELHVDMTEIRKGAPGSELLVGTIHEAMKGEA